MCLRLTYAEALLWKRRGAALAAKAKESAADIPCDPLFIANPRLSTLVSEIDSIKKRHGLLIEDALIWAINKLPGWEAAKEKIATAGGRAHLDCLAFSSSTSRLCVFECKRGHGILDADKVRAVDQRLDRVSQSIGAHALAKGWRVAKIETFLLSFYGTKWKSNYPIHSREDISTVFEPCVGRFVREFMDYTEACATDAYREELKASSEQAARRTIFELMEENPPAPSPDIVFDTNGVEFVPRGP